MIHFDCWIIIVIYALCANAHGFAIQILARYYVAAKVALDSTQYFLSHETGCQGQKVQLDMYYNPPRIHCCLMVYFDHQNIQQSLRCIT
jgi:hypothetical protein